MVAKSSLGINYTTVSFWIFQCWFLLINIDEWNLNNISSKAIEMLRDPDWVSKITHLDQDVLNVLLNGKVKFISEKYNTRYSINYELKDKVDNPVNDDTVFIHYVGPTKPGMSGLTIRCHVVFDRQSSFSVE